MSAPPLSAAPLATTPTSMPSGLVVLFLALMLGIQPVTTDLYLPALPSLTEGFGASMAQAQLTLTSLLLAFGASQLVWGPLSDRFGRRPILLCGLAVYTLAAVGSALAPSMALLVLWRTLQGAAMGAVVMCARALVRDLYAPEIGARVLSKGLSGLGVIACICAPLGGLLSDNFNWQAALVALAVFSAATLALVALRFVETAPRKNPRALQPRVLLATWLVILRNPTFWAFTLLATASYGVLFTVLASSSFVFIQVLALSKTQYGLVMFSFSFVYLLGTFLCRRLLARFGIRRTVALAAGVSLLGGSLVGIFGLLGWHTPAAIVLPFWLVALAHGVHQPCSQSGAVGPFPQAAGAASALNGFSMTLAAFGMGRWLGWRMDGTVFPLSNGVWFWSLCIAIVGWTLVQKYGEVRR
ncbi:multidrug effflux MFS transporter [Rhodoferax ferrireducens]|nr:multidrug effflux MFS transporter [Rhodoferax ferrireducens]